MITLVQKDDATFDMWRQRLYDDGIYVPGWLFSSLFKDPRGKQWIDHIAICHEGSFIIGVAVEWCYPQWMKAWNGKNDIGCYIIPDQRRKGYGRQVINALGGVEGKNYSIGKKDSEFFWQTLEEEREECTC